MSRWEGDIKKVDLGILQAFPASMQVYLFPTEGGGVLMACARDKYVKNMLELKKDATKKYKQYEIDEHKKQYAA